MAQKSLAKNALFYFLYRGVDILFPLVTAPYVSRVLGASNLGKVNFAASVVYWFLIVAMFGTDVYGIRETAKNREEPEKMNQIFSEIFLLNAVLSFLAFLVYGIIILSVETFQAELPLYFIMGLSLLLNVFNIEWFFHGIEEYRYITIRGGILKVLSLASIFLFIQNHNQYVLYGLISVGITSLSGIINCFHSRRFVKLTFKGMRPWRHLRNLQVFFFSTLVTSLYLNLDLTLLGFLVDSRSVAFMSRSKIVVTAAIAMSTSIANVTLPRASYYLQHDREKFNELLKLVPRYMLWLTLPMVVGCFILAPNLIFVLGGEEFQEAAPLLRLLSFVIVLSPLAIYMQNQVLVPSGKERVGLATAIICSILSIALNFTLIPRFGFMGAGIAMVMAELTSFGLRYSLVKWKYHYPIQLLTRSTLKYAAAAGGMAVIISLLDGLHPNPFLNLFLIVAIGALAYFGMLLWLKEEVMLGFFHRFIRRKKAVVSE